MLVLKLGYRIFFALPIFVKDSPWIKFFDAEITKIVRGGLVKKWKQVLLNLRALLFGF